MVLKSEHETSYVKMFRPARIPLSDNSRSSSLAPGCMQHECNTWVFCGSIPFWVRLWCCEDQETNPRNVAGLGAREQMLAWSFVCQALWMLLLLPTCTDLL